MNGIQTLQKRIAWLVYALPAALVLFALSGVVFSEKTHAQSPLEVIPFDLTADLGGTAEWSTGSSAVGSAAFLEAAGAPGTEARIIIDASDVGISTLNDLNTFSWDAFDVDGYMPHVDVIVDTGTGEDALVFEYAKVDPNQCDDAPYPEGDFNTFDNLGIVDDNAYAWLSSGVPGPCGDPAFDNNHMSLSDWKSTGTSTIDGTSTVLRFEIEVDNWVEDPSSAFVDEITVNGVTYYGLIQDAIDTASDGDIIDVNAGTYDEQLVINVDVTISGETGAVIQPTANNDDWDIQFVDGATFATLDGLELDFNGPGDTRAGRGIGVSDLNGDPVTDVAIQNNDIQMGVGEGASTVGLSGVGIQTGKNADVSGLVITNNTFHGDPSDTGNGDNNGAEGIYINPNAGSGLITISDNTFDGHLFVGISIESGNVTTSGNTITRATAADNSNTHGIRVNDFVGSVTYDDINILDNDVSGFENGLRLGSASDGGSTLTITVDNNIISDNDRGVWVREDAVVTARENQISGNVTFGAEVMSGAPELDAIENWWGDASGPEHSTNSDGTGDTVSDDVLFDPWCTTPDCSSLSSDSAPPASGGGGTRLINPDDGDATVEDDDDDEEEEDDTDDEEEDDDDDQQDDDDTDTPPVVITPPGQVLGTTTCSRVGHTFTRSLSIGMSGADVVELQERLRAEGFFTFHTSTGYFGPITQAAVIAYQARYGISQVGIVGPITRAQLNSTATVTTSCPSHIFTRNLSIGTRGADVVELQERLRAEGFFTFHTSTGYFGPITQAAVIAYQSHYRISPAVGFVGPITRAQLNSTVTSTSDAQATLNALLAELQRLQALVDAR